MILGVIQEVVFFLEFCWNMQCQLMGKKKQLFSSQFLIALSFMPTFPSCDSILSGLSLHMSCVLFRSFWELLCAWELLWLKHTLSRSHPAPLAFRMICLLLYINPWVVRGWIWYRRPIQGWVLMVSHCLFIF